MLLPDENVLVVLVSSACNIEYESSFVDQVLSLELEVLEPDVSFLVELRVSASACITNFE